MAASSGGIVAGKAFVLIEAIDKTGTVLSKVGKRMKDFGSGLSSLGSSLLTKSLAAGAPLALAVNAFRNFQSVMSDLQKTSGATDSKIAGVSQSLMDISKTTGVGPTDLAKGLQDLVAQGMDLDQAVASMQTVAQVSRATGSEITDVTKTAFQLQSALGIDPSQLSSAFDILASAGKQGAFELKDIAQHLPTIASQAASLGVSGVEGAASLAAMLQVVRKGAPDAATAANNLSNLFAKVISPETIKSFQAAGVNIEEIVKAAQAKGENPLEAVLDTVQQITGGDTFKVGQIFKDMQARNAIIPLLRFRKEYEAIRDSSKGAVGIIDADAAASAATLDGMLQSLWATLQRIGITVGQTLWPAVSAFGNWLASHLSTLEQWISDNRGLVLAIAAIPPLLAAVSAAAIVLGYAISGVGVALGVVGAILAFGGGIPAAIAGIAAGLIVFSQWDTLASGLGDTLGVLAETAGAVMDALAMGDLQGAWDIAIGGLKLAWLTFADTLMDAWGGVSRFFREVWTGTTMFLQTTWLRIQRFITDGILALGEYVLAMLEKIPGAKKLLIKGGFSSETMAQARKFAEEDYQRQITGVEEGAGNSLSDFTKQQQEADAGRQSVIDSERATQSERVVAIEIAKEDEAANALMNAWFDEWDKVEAEQGAAVPGGAPAAAMLAGAPGGGAAAAAPLDSGIRVSANEAIERGSIEAARVVAGDQMTALAEQQLTVLEKIAANTSPANQPSDEEEAV